MTYSDLIVLIPSHGLEDFPKDLKEKQAAGLLNAFAVVHHPSLIAAAETNPRWQRADDASEVRPDQLIILPTACDGLIPEGWIERSRREGSTVLTGLEDRQEMLDAALAPLEISESPEPELTADFLAFGTVWLQVELLTRQMRSYSQIDKVHLKRELVAAAKATIANDPEAAKTHLTRCYEMLLESRERFYPVDCYLLDVCLVTPDLADDSLAKLLDSPIPVNLMAPAATWQLVMEKDQSWQDQIREAIERGTVEVLGGDDEELDGTQQSVQSTLFHLQAGRRQLNDMFGRPPLTWSRKKFGLAPRLPSLLARSGYTGALHLVLDDGIYPEDEQSLFRWEGSTGETIPAFSRIPTAADSAAAFLRLPERIGDSMDHDHTAATAFARWPKLRSPFLEDLRRAHQYAPVLGQFVTFEKFFSEGTSPGRISRYKANEYFSPTLLQSVARREADPVSRWIHRWDRDRRFQEADLLHGLASLVKSEPGIAEASANLESRLRHLESDIDAAKLTELNSAIDEYRSQGLQRLRPLVTAKGVDKPGVLVINPLAFPRTVLVEWPTGSVPPQHPLVKNRQIDGDRSWALLDLPPCGFVWLPAEQHPGENTSPTKPLMAEELQLRTNHFQVDFSEVTGGISRVMTYRRSPNRISQQVALRFPHEQVVSYESEDGRETETTFYTAMRMREWRVVSEGPLLGEIETQGDLLDESSNEVVATYQQRTRVIRGRNVIQIELLVSPARLPEGDPWTNYLACRFAWQHLDVALSASMQQGAHAAGAHRIEAPQYLEIAEEAFRTTILTPGLCFHRMTGDRMLDTLLIAEGETERTFRFSVAVDHQYPMQAHLEEFSPPVVVPTETSPGDGAAQGWFVSVSAANVQLLRILPTDDPQKFVFRLLETEGRARVFGLHCFRPPKHARQIDFNGKQIVELRIDDAVNIEIAPYELCDVEVQF